MDRVKEFFETVADWWGPPKIRASDRERLSIITEAAGEGPLSILELGAGGGTTAVVAADAGHSVTAVEFAPKRAQFMRALIEEHKVETVTVVEDDFYTADVGGPFDCVMCWNAFGTGSDAEQRRLLRRVHDEWLRPEGTLLLDVFNPIGWEIMAGGKEERTATIELVNGHQFDPAASRFIDVWWPAGDESAAVMQSVRCYTVADFRLLLEGTGMDLAWVKVKGDTIDITARADSTHPLWTAWFYTCGLTRS